MCSMRKISSTAFFSFLTEIVRFSPFSSIKSRISRYNLNCHTLRDTQDQKKWPAGCLGSDLQDRSEKQS
ncbi:hypothetical protein GJ496_002424 [Pomphorhynchus laevis]|nr:hypothetical protein GJ496_002424 [Pomphorhynchus laevis]